MLLVAAWVGVGAVDHANADIPAGAMGSGERVAGPAQSVAPATRVDAPDAPDTPGQPVASRCAADMVLVEGQYCTNVDQQCQAWLDPDTQMRCARFAPSRCTGRRRPLSVCVDRYEYPNRPGMYPQVMTSWYEAERACTAQGKRLCTQSEWTFACEGPEMLPYPYGQNRDDTACRIDHQTLRPDRARLGNPMTSHDESARLYEAVPSGAMARCVSWAGVHDMTGNADEWTVNEAGRPFRSALKGGWWGHIRARCRPSTISHNEGFVYYQIGFRCCADPRS
ncbi:MAG: SUMF1/EgtB/PvdO family nonheme iron enzyme [Myxococcales bacterium]|nr:SUMF1/EgtB/PvdO family nonheme iron enzyme [Myxococcales bacterium]